MKNHEECVWEICMLKIGVHFLILLFVFSVASVCNAINWLFTNYPNIGPYTVWDADRIISKIINK